MLARTRIIPLAAALCATVLAACAGSDTAAEDTATASASASGDVANPGAGTVALSQLAGTWTVRAVPESGTDTTAVMSTLVATADTTGWTVTYPEGTAQPARVRVSGDSIITEVGPSPSTRRAGAMVTTTTVSRMVGDSLVGITTARYSTGADSVVRFRTTGKRTP